MKKAVILVLLIAAGAGGIWWWSASGAEKKVQILASEKLTRGSVRKVLEQTGIIKSQVGGIVKIGARTTGTIEKMLVKVGDRVETGQLVARIDSRELRAQAAEAGARLEAARAELKRVEQVYPLRIREAEAELAQARASGDYLQSNYRRLQELVAQRVISPDELENARQRAEVETSRIEARRATLERETREFREEQTKAQLGVRQAEATLDALEIRISYTSVKSPLAGLVSQVTAQEGETIVAGLQVANLVTVIDPSRLEMWIYVDETDVGQVQQGQKVEFQVDAYPGRVFEGEILTIYPEPEIRDNIVYFKALVGISAEQANYLKPEMTTKVQIVAEEKADVLKLPNAALKWVDSRQVVFVRDPDGSVRQVTPKLGLAGLTASEVLEGLGEGDEVATQVDLPGQAARKKKP